MTLQTDSQGLLNYFCFKKCDTKLDEIEDKLLELDIGITSLLLTFLMYRLVVVEDIFFHTKLGVDNFLFWYYGSSYWQFKNFFGINFKGIMLHGKSLLKVKNRQSCSRKMFILKKFNFEEVMIWLKW